MSEEKKLKKFLEWCDNQSYWIKHDEVKNEWPEIELAETKGITMKHDEDGDNVIPRRDVKSLAKRSFKDQESEPEKLNLQELQPFITLTEELMKAIDEVIQLPPCSECGTELNVRDDEGEVLEAPNWYCPECDTLRKVTEKQMKEFDKE